MGRRATASPAGQMSLNFSIPAVEIQSLSDSAAPASAQELPRSAALSEGEIFSQNQRLSSNFPGTPSAVKCPLSRGETAKIPLPIPTSESTEEEEDVVPDLDETPFILTREERGLSDRDEIEAKAARLAEILKKKFCAETIRLTITDNTSTVFTFRQRPKDGPLEIRLHHMFLNAPEKVLDDLAEFSRGGKCRRAASRRLGDFIDLNDDLLREDEPGFHQQKTTPLGRFRNLQLIFDRLNAEFFQGCIRATIGWGRLPSRRSRRSIRFGVYSPKTQSIRIHPVLDAPDVPDFFVDYIVFHEMLHQAIPAEEGQKGRRSVHTAEFLAAESAFPDFERAERWSRENIVRLLEEMPLRKPGKKRG